MEGRLELQCDAAGREVPSFCGMAALTAKPQWMKKKKTSSLTFQKKTSLANQFSLMRREVTPATASDPTRKKTTNEQSHQFQRKGEPHFSSLSFSKLFAFRLLENFRFDSSARSISGACCPLPSHDRSASFLIKQLGLPVRYIVNNRCNCVFQVFFAVFVDR